MLVLLLEVFSRGGSRPPRPARSPALARHPRSRSCRRSSSALALLVDLAVVPRRALAWSSTPRTHVPARPLRQLRDRADRASPRSSRACSRSATSPSYGSSTASTTRSSCSRPRGMMLLVSAVDLVMVFLGIEIMSIPVYVLAGFDRRKLRSNEAALKYFLIGAFATALLLYGMALLYGATGRTDFAGIRARLRRREPARARSGSASCSSASPSRSRPCRSTSGRPTSTRAPRRRSPPSCRWR